MTLRVPVGKAGRSHNEDVRSLDTSLSAQRTKKKGHAVNVAQTNRGKESPSL